jgi:NAD(P)H-dependent FMN reductase
MDAMTMAVREGGRDPALSGVEVVERAALSATVSDVLDADAYVVGSPVNLGYLSGALKHFFDQIYYPCLRITENRPFGAYLHGNEEATGALRAIEAITTGLGWRRVRPTLVVNGLPSAADLEACRELGAVVAAHLIA